MKKIIATLSLLALSLSAQAAPMLSSAEFDSNSILLDFDELSLSTVVNNQYSGSGVTISGSTGLDGAGSATNAVTSTWDPVYIGNKDNSWDGSIIFDFTTNVTQFGLELIDSLPAHLSVYDDANNLIETVMATLSGNDIFIGIDTQGQSISKAIISGDFYAIDDVQFNGGSDGGSEVPVPAAVWLFGTGLTGLMGVSRKKKQALAA